jgi:lysophospholipase L1-like esterase
MRLSITSVLCLACSGGPGDSADAEGPSAVFERCFPTHDPVALNLIDYDELGATVPAHCQGTDHQDITDIERLVFLGDSVTEGTPPSLAEEVYRSRVSVGMQERFGKDLVIDECAEWGGRMDDLLRDGDPSQILECFTEAETAHTLVVFTVGGNDMLAFGDELDAGKSSSEVLVMVDETIELLRDVMVYFADESLFPGGVELIFGNVYEYTDGTGDLGACPTAEILGYVGDYPEMTAGYAYVNQAMAELAVEFSRDQVFLWEGFCGHGFRADDPDGPCYRGAESPIWFDGTCIHPNPDGHAALAEMVLSVVDH